MAWFCDLDGVVWLAGHPITGAADAIHRLRSAGERVLFVTNNSSATVATQEATLAAAGVPAEGDVLTSAQAAALLLPPGSTALVCGGPGIEEALAARGVTSVATGDVDAVVVGFTTGFDYELLRHAHRAVWRGARLIGTNDDATYPTPEGPIPGGGALLAAVATAAGVTPTVAGKPYGPMADLAMAMVGPGRHTVVGDRPSTDGLFARELGARFALVLSGVTTPADLPVDPTPDIVAPDLAALVERVLAGQPAEPTGQ